MNTVSIVGVGLIGGSFALALRQHGFTGRIIGVSSARSLAAARQRGAIDEGLSLEEAIPASDLIYLAQPIGRIIDVLPRVVQLARPQALITDAGSTKAAIVARAQSLLNRTGPFFLGGHPMAGKAERGVEFAEAGLFQGATYVLTPKDGILPAVEPVRVFCNWLEKLGSRTVVMDPEEHDHLVSFTSHLPQMVSTALASLVLEEIRSSESWMVAGRGLRDMTRLARSAYELWRDICMTNTHNIDRALSRYIQTLEHLRENLRSRALEEQFQRGARFAAEFQKKNQNVT